MEGAVSFAAQSVLVGLSSSVAAPTKRQRGAPMRSETRIQALDDLAQVDDGMCVSIGASLLDISAERQVKLGFVLMMY